MKRTMLLAAMVATLAACASTPLAHSVDPKLSLYRAHAGEPVGSFQYFGRLNGWTPLGNTALAVWTRPHQAYLLEMSGPCHDLDFAPAISVSNHMSQVSARFDSVTALGGGVGPIQVPCRIQTIRPLDIKALKQAQREMREAKVVEREQQQR